MDSRFIRQLLESNLERISGLLEGFSDQDMRWKPSPGEWSMLEVLHHLADEEELDFRPRIELTLEDSQQAWPPIDPEAWVERKQYNQQDVDRVLTRFRESRRNSLAWLDSLSDPDWGTVHTAPFGQISAGDLLASWAAHDQLHLRQLVEIQHGLLGMWTRPYAVDYAGTW